MQHAHNDTFADVTGVILAGGRSSRMGRDKATLALAGERLFDRVRRTLAALLPQLLIAGDRPDLATPAIPCHPDLYPGSALGGLYTGLYHAATPYVFVSACDMPWPDPVLIRALLARRQGHDIVVLRGDDGLEPLFAVYGKGCLEPMRQLLAAGRFRILDFFHQVRVCELTAADLPAGWRRAVTNLNTPEELRRAGEEPMTQVVSVVAKSGTGKTTLLEKLIAELKRRGYRVGAIKHDAHRFDIDREGKDSWRLTQAGADTMMITSPAKMAMVKQNAGDEPALAETVARWFGDVDIVLTEGFKRNSMPKIEVHRRERSAELLCRGQEQDPTLFAVASDEALALDVPVYDINDAAGLCDLIEARFLR